MGRLMNYQDSGRKTAASAEKTNPSKNIRNIIFMRSSKKVGVR
jgi:hypothetical protein